MLDRWAEAIQKSYFGQGDVKTNLCEAQDDIQRMLDEWRQAGARAIAPRPGPPDPLRPRECGEIEPPGPAPTSAGTPSPTGPTSDP